MLRFFEREGLIEQSSYLCKRSQNTLVECHDAIGALCTGSPRVPNKDSVGAGCPANVMYGQVSCELACSDHNECTVHIKSASSARNLPVDKA